MIGEGNRVMALVLVFSYLLQGGVWRLRNNGTKRLWYWGTCFSNEAEIIIEAAKAACVVHQQVVWGRGSIEKCRLQHSCILLLLLLQLKLWSPNGIFHLKSSVHYLGFHHCNLLLKRCHLHIQQTNHPTNIGLSFQNLWIFNFLSILTCIYIFT